MLTAGLHSLSLPFDTQDVCLIRLTSTDVTGTETVVQLSEGYKDLDTIAVLTQAAYRVKLFSIKEIDSTLTWKATWTTYDEEATLDEKSVRATNFKSVTFTPSTEVSFVPPIKRTSSIEDIYAMILRGRQTERRLASNDDIESLFLLTYQGQVDHCKVHIDADDVWVYYKGVELELNYEVNPPIDNTMTLVDAGRAFMSVAKTILLDGTTFHIVKCAPQRVDVNFAIEGKKASTTQAVSQALSKWTAIGTQLDQFSVQKQINMIDDVLRFGIKMMSDINIPNEKFARVIPTLVNFSEV